MPQKPELSTSLISAPSCDHFGRHGEWKKYNLATKMLAKFANLRTTDLKRNLLDKLPNIADEFNQ